MKNSNLKELIVNFWNYKPCGTGGNIPEDSSYDYFEKIKDRRYKLEPFILKFGNFSGMKNKKVLEIGCGLGTDGIQIILKGADYTGIDISSKSLELAKKNFEINEAKGNLLQADVEKLPFSNNSFDYVYSWGVLHHIPNIQKAVEEIYRILKPEGRLIIMIYNKYSLVGLQLYIKYGFLKGKIKVKLDELYASHHESPGTKAFTDEEAEKLFHQFRDTKINNVVTSYDVRVAKNIFLPKVFQYLIPSKFGFFKIIRAQK